MSAAHYALKRLALCVELMFSRSFWIILSFLFNILPYRICIIAHRIQASRRGKLQRRIKQNLLSVDFSSFDFLDFDFLSRNQQNHQGHGNCSCAYDGSTKSAETATLHTTVAPNPRRLHWLTKQ